MYRIELAPGEQTVYRTVEELAVGLRNGLVTSRSRIFHNATQKWLPIEFHPHYKKAIELSAHRQELPSAAPLPERLDTLNFAVPRPAVQAHSAPIEEPEQEEPEPVAPEPLDQVPVPAARVEPPSGGGYEPPASRAPVVHRESLVHRASVVHTPAETEPSTPVMFFHSPAAVEDLPDEPRAPDPALPPVVASPVLQFPAIVYPEITPAEAPVAEPEMASQRGRRPLHVAGAILLLALGGYGMMSFAPATRLAPAAAASDRLALPAPTSESVIPPAVAPGSGEPTIKPIVMLEPASSGFAPALEPRAIVSSAAAARGSARTAAVQDSSLTPAPVDIQLDVPVLPVADSLVTPRTHNDSAMKRILRAVNGGKDLPPRP